MTDKKQEMVNHMSDYELVQLILRLEQDLMELEDCKNLLSKKHTIISAQKGKLAHRWKDLAYEIERFNNDFLLKATNEKRELLICQLKRQGVNLTSEFEQFLCEESENISINNGKIILSSDLTIDERITEVLEGTGMTLESGVITTPGKKSSRLLGDLVKNNAEREIHRQDLGYYEVADELEGVKQEYTLSSIEGNEISRQVGYYDMLITEKQQLLDYCVAAVPNYSEIFGGKQKVYEPVLVPTVNFKVKANK